MKKILTLVLLALVSGIVMAVPAKRIKRTITLADGTTVEVERRGDEHVHFYAAEDGRLFQFSEERKCFDPISREAIEKRWTKKIQENNERRLARSVKRKAKWGAEKNPISGKKKGLVILVNFQDKKMIYSNANFQDFFNKEGYSQNGISGSVHDYFWDASYGQFDLTFDVVGPVTVSKSLSYYGQNDSGGNDVHAAAMIGEAVKLANPSVDFSDYDWDGDGEVDQVYVIYAGYGEAQSEIANTIWPHEYDLYSANYYGDGPGILTLDGVKINTYACSCELNGSTGTKMDGIGTACHEFSHCMCLPDMYDTNGRNFGMDSWDLMDYGSYSGPNFNGGCPAPYTSYERMYCGWLSPIELQDPAIIKDMPALTDEPVAYMIRNSGNRNEYYLLENHQKTGWDKYAGGHGMLVLHVDYDANAWINNSVNTTASRQRMTIIPADNKLTNLTLAGDPWPGTSLNRELTDTSSPKATLYNYNANNQKLMGHPITEITELNGKISFLFDGGVVIGTPDGLAAEEITDKGFTATWNAVDGADYYEVELTSKTKNLGTQGEFVLEETFSKFKATMAMDVSSKLNLYTNAEGWTGSKVFTDNVNAMAKLGSSSYSGYLQTPAVAHSSDVVTVVVGTMKYNVDVNEIQLSIGDEVISSFAPQSSVTYTLAQVKTDEDISLKIATTTKRAYVSYVGIYDGELTKDDFESIHRLAPLKAKDVKTFETNENHYDFTSLSGDNTYSFRVRAVLGDIFGEWSEPIDVELKEDEDGIMTLRDLQSETRNNMMYDLSGRRISIPTKGIYIQGGKKVVR